MTLTSKNSAVRCSICSYSCNSRLRKYEHQRNRERKSKEELDRNQANIARSIDTNVSGMMPNGDPAPKRELKIWQKIVLGVTWGAVTAKDYYDHFVIDSQTNNEHQRKNIEPNKNVDTKKENSFILTPIKDRLDEKFKKNW